MGRAIRENQRPRLRPTDCHSPDDDSPGRGSLLGGFSVAGLLCAGLGRRFGCQPWSDWEGRTVARNRSFRNATCPCGSGKKYKHCCYGKGVEDDLALGAGQPPQYPLGTVALYGPDDKTTTKIAAGVILHDGAEPILMRWVATDVTTNPKVQQELKDFFLQHAVKQVVISEGHMGCPHEEGEDFPEGEDCPFCPFWKGKQGSNRRD